MAEPERQPRAQASSVRECHATDCTHNENKDCHAGSIVVRMSDDGHATCETYEPEGPAPRP